MPESDLSGDLLALLRAVINGAPTA